MPSKLVTGTLVAATVFLLATNPLVATAAGTISSSDIVNNTIKSNDVKNGAIKGQDIKDASVAGVDVADGSLTGADIQDSSVTEGDLQPSARGAKVISYDLGSFDFSSGGFLTRQLPGTWDAATVAASTWTVTAHQASINRFYLWPGHGQGGSTQYRVSVGPDGRVYIDKIGAGELYGSIRLNRTVATSAQSTAPRPAAPALPRSDG